MKLIKRVFVIYIIILLSINYAASGDENSITGILGAFDEEVKMLEKNVTGKKEQIIEGIRFITGEIKGRHIVLACTGAGKVNAAMITTLLIEHFKPREVIFTGIAGGINPDLLPGDIVIAEKTAQHDLGTLTPDGYENWGARNPIDGNRNPVFFPADTLLLSLAETSVKRVIFAKIHTGTINRIPEIIKGIIVTGDTFVSSPAKKSELRENFQADAVEMEGAAVAQICWQHGVGCLVIRSLSDKADENAFQDYEKFYIIAARNSAMLVVDIIKQLALKQSSLR